MTSEPDSPTRRRPPTIDLTATEIKEPSPAAEDEAKTATERPTEEAADDRAAEPEAATKPAGGRASDGAKPRGFGAAGGAFAGAIVIAAILGGLWLAGLVPAREGAAPANTAATNDAAIDRLSARLDKIEAALQASKPDPTIGSRLAAVEGETKALGDSLAALNRRLDDVAVTAKDALARANAAAAAAEAARTATQGGVQRSDLDALASRIAALETAIKALSDDAKARRASGSEDRAARLVVAAEALQGAVERGAPFTTELALVQSLDADPSATAALEPFATAGVATAGQLAHELSQLIPALRKASVTAPADASSDGSLLGRFATSAQKLVRITPIDAPPGADPTSIVARLDGDAARADLPAALADIARLPDAAKALAAPWVAKVNARNAAITVSARIVGAALAALGNVNTQ